MCGIYGAYSIDGSPLNHAWLRHMADSLGHRGPDDSGFWCADQACLGHRRLSIIDLSPAGHQPMANENFTVWVTYNGEIYNFRQLRDELRACGHVFRSSSDTEVIIHGYEEWGQDCWSRLDGIFALGLFDRRSRTLFLVRDPLGVKPLFYHLDRRTLAFASEPLALFGPGRPVPDLDPSDLDAFFTFNYLPAPRSGLVQTRQLPAASWLSFGAAGLKQGRYWRPAYVVQPEPYTATHADRLGELLRISVRDQMISDVPVGLFLSGGLDSFSVAQAAGAAGASPQAFTLSFSEPAFDENPAAQEYLRFLGWPGASVHFHWDAQDILETLGDMGELLADASCFPLHQLCRHARRQVKVILAGDGGDELWAGYDTYRASGLTPWVRRIPRPARSALLMAAHYLPSDDQRYGYRMVITRLVRAAEEGVCRDHACFRRIMDNQVKARLYDPGLWQAVRANDPVAEYADLMTEVPSQRSHLTKCQHADLMFHLPSILAKVDRMSMAHGLEVRVPILGKSVVEFSLNLSDEAKLFRGQGKRVLRDAMRPCAPASAFRRPKAGFLPPVDKWFRTSGPMQEVFDDYLDRAARQVDGLNLREVRNFWNQHRRNELDGGFILLGILQYINWRLQCLSKAMA